MFNRLKRTLVRLGALGAFAGWFVPRLGVTIGVLSAGVSIEGLAALAAWWGYAPALAALAWMFPGFRRAVRRLI